MQRPRRTGKRWLTAAMSLLLALTATLPFARPAGAAATWVVTSLADTGGTCPSADACTLRGALNAAQAGDTITFGVTGTITLGSTLTLTKNVTIQGPGATSLALDGNTSESVLTVNIEVTAAISGLTIQHGGGSQGGGIFNAGALTVTSSTITDNHTSAFGGGIAGVGGSLQLIGSTVHTNTAPNGAGIVASSATVLISNSTISGNSVTGSTAIGGGILGSNATLTVAYSTVTKNSASIGGGVASTGGSIILRRSIVAENSATIAGQNCVSPVTSEGNNLADIADCFSASSASGDIVNATVGLGPLVLNGGTTPTHALLDGSPAIDAVVVNPTECGTTVATDQRGVRRPQVGAVSRCDIGAYERAGKPPVIGAIGSKTLDEDTALIGPTLISFTLADEDTSTSALQLTATSSNQSIVPDTGLVLGGSGAQRTLSVTPLPDQNGTLNVTIATTDGVIQAFRTFTVTIVPRNDPPVNTVPTTGQALPVDQNGRLVFSPATGRLISVADIDAGGANIQVQVSTDHGTIALNGTADANGLPSVTVTGPIASVNNALNGLRYIPTPGYTGAATLQIVTSDLGNTGVGGVGTDTDTVPLTVQPVNLAPTITSLGDQAIDEDTTATIPFTVGDPETAASALTVTATSSHQALLPNSAITIIGTGAARTLRLTPAANQSGTAQVTVTVGDGGTQISWMFTLTVAPVNDAPVAADDSYAVGAVQTLTVTAADGVLKNDTDVDSKPGNLTAAVVAGPQHGSLSLNPTGGFTYTPQPGFAGVDSFTYRTSDGTVESPPATVTITVTPSTCAPRATVKVTTAVIGGKLQATVEALPLSGQENNRLKEIGFGAYQNGRVTMNGQAVASGATYTPPTSTTRAVFQVERVARGKATTIPLMVTDECGQWPTFVGGGPDSGF